MADDASRHARPRSAALLIRAISALLVTACTGSAGGAPAVGAETPDRTLAPSVAAARSGSATQQAAVPGYASRSPSAPAVILDQACAVAPLVNAVTGLARLPADRAEYVVGA